MKRKDIVEQAQTIKTSATAQEVKAADLDVIVTDVMKLPKGQLKKVLTAPVLEVLKKYGYTEE